MWDGCECAKWRSGETKTLSLTCLVFSTDVMYQDASLKKSRILSYFWLCSRSGRSTKRRSESALTHMFCVLDWHDVSRCIASLKKFEKSYATFDWVHPASQRSIPKAEKQKRSHSHVLRSHNVNRAHKFKKSYDTFDWVHAAVHPWTQTKAA